MLGNEDAVNKILKNFNLPRLLNNHLHDQQTLYISQESKQHKHCKPECWKFRQRFLGISDLKTHNWILTAYVKLQRGKMGTIRIAFWRSVENQIYDSKLVISPLHNSLKRSKMGICQYQSCRFSQVAFSNKIFAYHVCLKNINTPKAASSPKISNHIYTTCLHTPVKQDRLKLNQIAYYSIPSTNLSQALP